MKKMNTKQQYNLNSTCPLEAEENAAAENQRKRHRVSKTLTRIFIIVYVWFGLLSILGMLISFIYMIGELASYVANSINYLVESCGLPMGIFMAISAVSWIGTVVIFVILVPTGRISRKKHKKYGTYR
jgi:hypothetical protein